KGNAATCVSVVTVLPYDGNNLIDNSGNGDQDVELTNAGVFDFVVYPNPTSGTVNVAMEIKGDETIFIRIFDLNGRLIYLQETEAFEGENVFRLHLDELKSGLYVIDVQTDKHQVQKRLLKQD
ncbi:MAG: T9SS type A sorting domain-containing protein, partial [Saprospiraceae bacterium]|nr:T9SS type A sorting domain-containing protein [Saprospiraceae bacterium]